MKGLYLLNFSSTCFRRGESGGGRGMFVLPQLLWNWVKSRSWKMVRTWLTARLAGFKDHSMGVGTGTSLNDTSGSCGKREKGYGEMERIEN